VILGAEGGETLTNRRWVKTCRHDDYAQRKGGLHLLGALDLPVTLEARRSPILLLLLLLLLVPLGVITPRWWWWRDRRTDAPRRVVGPRAGLLGPTCSPLALRGGL
jgi:hypothetical protein